MKTPTSPSEKTIEPASQRMLELAAARGYKTVWDRAEAQLPYCKFGEAGTCCNHCAMGPCRMTKKTAQGVCGATADTIVSRNLIRHIAAGVAAHSDHGRSIVNTFKEIVEGRNTDYDIKDSGKLNAIAIRLGLPPTANVLEIAREVANIAGYDYGKQDDTPTKFMLAYAPRKRLERWASLEEFLYESTKKKLGVLPRGIDREVVDSLHRTHIGVDHDVLSLLEVVWQKFPTVVDVRE